MNGKSPFASKTLIVNGLVLVVATLTALQGHELIASNPRATAWVVAGIGFVNAVLRLITWEPIRLGD